MNKDNEYYGVYDQKESNTFRPTIEKRVHKDYPVSKTLTCREDSCCVIERESNLRIRKLTPLETTKLMGFEKKDWESLKEAGLSDAQIYHCCGDSIVVSVLISIFSQLLGVEHKEIVEKYVEGIVKGE